MIEIGSFQVADPLCWVLTGRYNKRTWGCKPGRIQGSLSCDAINLFARLVDALRLTIRQPLLIASGVQSMQASSSSRISVRIRVETGRPTSLATESMKLRNSLSGAERAPPFRDCCTQTDSGRGFSSVSGISLCGFEFEIPVLLRKSPSMLVVDASGKSLSRPMEPRLHRRKRDIESVG